MKNVLKTILVLGIASGLAGCSTLSVQHGIEEYDAPPSGKKHELKIGQVEAAKAAYEAAVAKVGEEPLKQYGKADWQKAQRAVAKAEHSTDLQQAIVLWGQATDFVKKAEITLEKRRGLEEGRKWVADLGSGVTMEFMPIAPGSFQMGSNNGGSAEKPVHQVTISKPFWMAKTEVTQAQYQQVMGRNPSSFKGAQNPADTVSGDDAMNFCINLTEIEHQSGRLSPEFEYALPTEAQWEYACRAGTTGKYAGSLDAMAWYKETSKKKTHSVGAKQANAFGLYDMHGNVWEWCADWYASKSYGENVTDPEGPSSGSFRVIRGGCWADSASDCRSAFRSRDNSSDTCFYFGFRVLVQQKNR